MFMTDPMPSWRDRLLAGDVVSFFFPSSEGHAELEKARPSLVLAIDRTHEEPLVTIAYGTSSRSRSNTGSELHVRKWEDINAAGLHKQTRFIGARTTTVPLSSLRFVECAAGTAVLGRLPPSLHSRLAQVVAGLDRGEDQARRGSGRRSPWGRRRPSTGVVRNGIGFASGPPQVSVSRSRCMTGAAPWPATRLSESG